MKTMGNGPQELVEISGKTLGWLAQMAGAVVEKSRLGDGIVCCRPNPAIGGYSCVNERGEVIWNAAGYAGPIPKPCPPGGAPPPPRAVPPLPPPPRPVPPPPGGGGAPPIPPQGVNPTSPAPAVASCCRAYWNDHEGVWYMACNDGKSSSEEPITAASVADWNARCSQGGQPPGGGGAAPPGPVRPLPLPHGTVPTPPPLPPGLTPPSSGNVRPGPIPGGQPVHILPISPKPVTGPTVGVRLEIIEKLLSSVEDAWQTAMRLIVRADRCSAGDADKAARDQALACLEAYRKAAGQLRPALTELCEAKRAGRNANLNAGQVQALEALALCVSKITAASVQAATSSGPDWLRAVVGTVLPAAGSVLVAVT